MIHDFIKMIDNIESLYGFIYECANLINNLYDYDNYDHLAIKLCSEFIMPIVNIAKKEHTKEYNEHIKDIIDNLESIKDIYSICIYLAPMNDYFDSCKKCYSHYYCSCYYYHKKKSYMYFSSE